MGKAEKGRATPGHLANPCPGPRCSRARSLLWSLACKLWLIFQSSGGSTRGLGTCPRLQGPGLLLSLGSSLSLLTVCLLCPLPQRQRPRPIRPWDPSTCMAWAMVGSTEPSASCIACEACRGPSVELVPTAVTELVCGQQVSECRPKPSDSTFGAPSFLKIMLICSPLVINLVRVQ